MEQESGEAHDPVRVRLDFGYDGTDFCGWAAQPGLRSVEAELSAALVRVLRLPGVRLTVAGRTDAGVHATGAVAHLDVPAPAWAALPGRSDRTPQQALPVRLAGVLPPDIVVRAAQAVPSAFDARFSALWRRYEYRLGDRLGWLDPCRRRDTVEIRPQLNVASAHRAAQVLLGLHDFAAFCKRRQGATTIRTLQEFSWRREPDGVVVATVIADAFCHSMVRALVGCTVAVGQGRRPSSWPESVLLGRSRDSGVTVMPARGLCLREVGYPSMTDPVALADRARAARSVRVELAGRTSE